MKRNIFVYPIVPKKLNETGNPYINDLTSCLEENGFNIPNKKDDRRHGIFSLFNYLFKCDIFYFNWIENLPQKKLGIFQTVLFLFQLLLLKAFNKKIVWTLHNLDSHYSKNSLYTMLQFLMLRASTIIVTHSKESFTFLKKQKIDNNKVFYFFHPFSVKPSVLDGSVSRINDVNYSPQYDILIWGAMNPYKGILELVSFCQSNETNLRIHIAGRFKDRSYFEKINSRLTQFITIQDEFISDEELVALHRRSKYILFPYNGKSVLNSGAVVFSLTLKSQIIGPRIGAFKELEEERLISTFTTYEDIFEIIKMKPKYLPEAIENFVSNHSWTNFAVKLSNRINQNI